MRPIELVPGNCYFSVGYSDGDLLFPAIQTLVYVGTDEDSETGRRLWMFREPSFTGAGAEAQPEDDQVMVVFPDEELHRIVDLNGLMRTLGELAPEHPLHRPPPDLGPAGEADLGELEAELERFLQTPRLKLLTIAIRFTDDGLSFMRRADGSTDLVLTPHPRLGPERESGLRALCLSAGWVPREDYLSDHGRTRVLAYRVRPDDRVALARLAGRIFLEVYRMRRGDALAYRVRSAESESDGRTSG